MQLLSINHEGFVALSVCVGVRACRRACRCAFGCAYVSVCACVHLLYTRVINLELLVVSGGCLQLQGERGCGGGLGRRELGWGAVLRGGVGDGGDLFGEKCSSALLGVFWRDIASLEE